MEQLTAEKLAEVLQEPNLLLLRSVVRILGHNRTAAVLVDTLQVEANGGMMTADGTRKRTPGGTFLQLVRAQARPDERRRLFPRPAPKPGKREPQTAQLITWEEMFSITQTLATAPAGEARTMKITLVGRPGKVETRQQCVVFKMQGRPPGSLPKGLPPAPAGPPLTWVVMVAAKQWGRVKDSLASNEQDQIIVEGYPAQQGNQLVLLAQSVTSVAQQREKKQAQQQAQAATA